MNSNGEMKAASKRKSNIDDAFSVLMRGAAAETKRQKTKPASAKAGRRSNSNPWADKLLMYCKSPETSPRVVEFDDDIVVIKDAYPKAKHHFLVLGRKRQFSECRDLKPGNESEHLVEAMISAGNRVMAAAQAACGKRIAHRSGFHSLPSMNGLHLHVISQDFVSDALKTKRHYNSFTTSFFIDAKKALTTLKEGSCIEVDADKCNALLKQSLRCHVCREPMKNIPCLKRHLLDHCDGDDDDY